MLVCCAHDHVVICPVQPLHCAQAGLNMTLHKHLQVCVCSLVRFSMNHAFSQCFHSIFNVFAVFSHICVAGVCYAAGADIGNGQMLIYGGACVCACVYCVCDRVSCVFITLFFVFSMCVSVCVSFHTRFQCVFEQETMNIMILYHSPGC